jgi:hypothetical protein
MPIRTITHNGRTDTLSGWAETVGISHEGLVQRLSRGWSEAEAVTTRNTCRAPDRAKRKRARERARADVERKPASVVFPPYGELKRQHLATQRQFNSLLRQFTRDLHGLMGRGVVADLLENANDRTTPVTRGLS